MLQIPRGFFHRGPQILFLEEDRDEREEGDHGDCCCFAIYCCDSDEDAPFHSRPLRHIHLSLRDYDEQEEVSCGVEEPWISWRHREEGLVVFAWMAVAPSRLHPLQSPRRESPDLPLQTRRPTEDPHRRNLRLLPIHAVVFAGELGLLGEQVEDHGEQLVEGLSAVVAMAFWPGQLLYWNGPRGLILWPRERLSKT
jgi:hypothetical protein